jgi:hypothetical protein
MIPVHSKIHPAQLHGQYVEFSFPTSDGRLTGLGKFEAQRNLNGFDYVTLKHEEISLGSLIRTPYLLSQEFVDRIQQQDSVFVLEA